MAAPLHPEPHDAGVVDAHQLDVAAMGLEVRAALLQRAPHPGLEIDRVQIVQQQHARHHLVAGELIDDRGAGRAVPANGRQHPVERGAVQLHHRAHQLLRHGASGRVGRGLEALDQLLDGRDPTLGFGRSGSHRPKNGEW